MNNLNYHASPPTGGFRGLRIDSGYLLPATATTRGLIPLSNSRYLAMKEPPKSPQRGLSDATSSINTSSITTPSLRGRAGEGLDMDDASAENIRQLIDAGECFVKDNVEALDEIVKQLRV